MGTENILVAAGPRRSEYTKGHGGIWGSDRIVLHHDCGGGYMIVLSQPTGLCTKKGLILLHVNYKMV